MNMSLRKRLKKSIQDEKEEDTTFNGLSKKKRPRKDTNKDVNSSKEGISTEEIEIQDGAEEHNGKNLNIKSKKPSNYEEVVENLRKTYKELHIAEDPVDSFSGDPREKRYLTLLSLIISSRTKDQLTFAATQKLIDHGCSLENVLQTPDEKLGELIYPVSFWKNKVKYIRKTSEKMRDKFDGDIPKTVKELCQLDGVGPKVAHLCMKSAWGQVSGIAVDTHVFRLSKRLGWTKSNTPEDCETELESWIPKDSWGEIEDLLVNFGQQICEAKNPQCKTCPNQNICPYGISQLKRKRILKCE